MSGPVLFLLLCLALGGPIAAFLHLRRRRASGDGRLQLVRQAAFHARPLMNGSELQLFLFLDGWVRQHARDHHVAPQTTYGAFLGCKDKNAWRLVGSKRADFVIFDSAGRVRLVVEFDGPGHHGNGPDDARDVRDRDRLKDLAASLTGIPLLRLSSLDNRLAMADALRQTLTPLNPQTRKASRS